MGGPVNSQFLRIALAGGLALVTTTFTGILALTQTQIPVELAVINASCLAFLFGTVTNGSGLGRGGP